MTLHHASDAADALVARVRQQAVRDQFAAFLAARCWVVVLTHGPSCQQRRVLALNTYTCPIAALIAYDTLRAELPDSLHHAELHPARPITEAEMEQAGMIGQPDDIYR